MTTRQPSSSSSLIPPRSNPPMIPAQPFLGQSAAAKTEHRWPRKRRLTAPADLQPRAAIRQVNRKAHVVEGDRAEVQIAENVDDLIPEFRTMGTDTMLYTPQSGVDAASIPFVFDDGILSFYTPSPESSDTGSSISPPASSASSASFLGVLPHHPRHCRLDRAPVFLGLSIWRGSDEKRTHIYAQTDNGFPSCARGVVSLSTIDPSMLRYAPIHTALSQLQCQFMHVDIPLAATTINEHYPVDSSITISTLLRGPVRLMTTLYTRGTLVSSHEVDMEAETQPHSEGTSYSAPFPHDIIDRIYMAAKWGREQKTVSDDSYSAKDALDSVVVLQLLQHDGQASFGGSQGEETMLVVVCGFSAYTGPLPGEIKASHLSPGSKYLHMLPSRTKSLPTPPPSQEHLTGLKDNIPSPHFPRRQRAPPKLSVAIPPLNINIHGKGHIELCCDSRLSPDSPTRPAPQTGVPQNVLPVTPFEQVIHTPLFPPEMPRSIRSRAGYAPTPTESAYPFTLSTTSPGTAQSPAFGVLDTASGPGGSAPAWLTLHRNATPFTPSLFLQHPQTASASNAMSSMTQRALDAGTPTFPSRLRKGEYFDPPLASPHLIASAPLFSTAHMDPDNLGPRSSGWPSTIHSPQSS